MENKIEGKIDVKVVDGGDDVIITPQEKETAVLDAAVESGEVDKQYGLQEDGVYKVNMDKPPIKQEENAIPERETEEIPVGERTGDSQEVDGEVRVESIEEDNSKKEEINETIEDSPLELIKDEDETKEKEIEEKVTVSYTHLTLPTIYSV